MPHFLTPLGNGEPARDLCMEEFAFFHFACFRFRLLGRPRRSCIRVRVVAPAYSSPLFGEKVMEAVLLSQASTAEARPLDSDARGDEGSEVLAPF